MSYLNINNLYKDQRILLFRECYALEKVHGTSAHVGFDYGRVSYFAGGESHERFAALFDGEKLRDAFAALGHSTVTVYGEAYGGRCMGMKATYGEKLRFIAFDVRIGEHWLAVPDAEQVVTALGIEFVPYVKVLTDVATLDAERDRPSEVAVRRGCGNGKAREGVVLRPLIEVRMNNGKRIIAKHKTEKYSERATPQKIVDPDKLAVLSAADAIAAEWVTEMRLTHVLQRILDGDDIKATPKVIAAMVEDVYREAKGEIVESREARTAIGKRTAALFKARLQLALRSVDA